MEKTQTTFLIHPSPPSWGRTVGHLKRSWGRGSGRCFIYDILSFPEACGHARQTGKFSGRGKPLDEESDLGYSLEGIFTCEFEPRKMLTQMKKGSLDLAGSLAQTLYEECHSQCLAKTRLILSLISPENRQLAELKNPLALGWTHSHRNL